MTIRKVPALGQAWSGNWRARVIDRVRERGFASVAAFAEAHPTWSTIELADELSTDHPARLNQSDVAADQVVSIWREEAHSVGDDAFSRFARQLLVGELHRRLPEGWRSEWQSAEAQPAGSRRDSLGAFWIGSMTERYEAMAERVFDAMDAAGASGFLPSGWLPAGADDPLLIEIFRRHWREKPE
jgi:hypothetical protein